MNKFFEIVGKWDMLGQWVFFLAVVFGLYWTVATLGWYITVWVRGWPPDYFDSEVNEIDGDGDGR